ncbi:MAG: nucleotidyltransferase family protein [Bacteroidota bacterium]
MNNAELFYLNGKILAPVSRAGERDEIADCFSQSGFDWTRWINLSSNHLVLQALYARLSLYDLLHLLPGEVKDHLFMIYDMNRKRNLELMKQVEDLNSVLSAENITPVYMKGVAHILDGHYSDPAERLLLDIDFLVPERDWERSATLLMKNGYQTSRPYDPLKKESLKHFPRLHKPGAPFYVEIHRLVVPQNYADSFSTETALSESRFTVRDKRCAVLSEKHMVYQNFIHSQLQHKSHLYARIFMRNLYDLLVLSSRTDVFAALQSIKGFEKQKAGYADVFIRTFGLDPKSYSFPVNYRHRYAKRFDASLRSGFISGVNYFVIYFFDRIIPKIFRSYIRTPIRALFDKDARRYLGRKLRDPLLIRNQFRFFHRWIHGKT